MERGQNININRSLEEVDSNSGEWLWRLQNFSGVTSGGDSKKLELEVEGEG